MGVFLGCAPRWALRLYSDGEPGEPLFYIETDRLVVALTIDDGPDPMTTPAILWTSLPATGLAPPSS